MYREVNLGKTVIGKDRQIDVFVHAADRSEGDRDRVQVPGRSGTADEKIPYALQDLAALWVPGLPRLRRARLVARRAAPARGSRLAAYCLPEHPDSRDASKATRELDYMLAATFGFWEQILPANKRFKR